MLLLVLSARPDLEVNRRLMVAADERGHTIAVEDGSRLTAALDPKPSLWNGDLRVDAVCPDAVLARVGNWRPRTMLAALEVLESNGVPTPNSSRAIRIGRDHWKTIRLLCTEGIATPKTLAGADPEPLAEAAEARLGFPLVVKQRASRQGIGVIRCDNRDHLEAVLDSLWRVGDEVVLQSYVESGGVSLRLFVIARTVVAAARFVANPGEWRSNAARGARCEAYEPNEEERELACDAAGTLGLGICGVDILPGPNGPVVCEVNPSPGFLHLEQATGIDMAGRIVEALVALKR